jgi:COP9 signalosome complex subunit 7
MTETASLLTFVQSAKVSSSEAVLVPLIRQVLSAPDVFVFGELLELENIKQLAVADGEGRKWVQVLEIFAYGRYSDYSKLRTELAPVVLNEKQARKLKQLSVVALAHESRVIAYSTLLRELELASLRELEDIVIDALYRELIVAKLDHAHAQLEVAHAIGRDVRAKDVGALVAAVEQWTGRAESLLGVLDDLAQRARANAEAHAQHDASLAKKLEELRSVVKTSLDADSDANMAQQLQMQQMQQMGVMGMMGMMGEDRGRGKKDKHKPGQQQGRHMH